MCKVLPAVPKHLKPPRTDVDCLRLILAISGKPTFDWGSLMNTNVHRHVWSQLQTFKSISRIYNSSTSFISLIGSAGFTKS